MGRSLKHLVILLDDLQALGVGFISVREGLDWTTPGGRLQAQRLAMIAEFERARIERVVAGLARAKAQGPGSDGPKREFPTSSSPSCAACRCAKRLDASGFRAPLCSGALARIQAQSTL